MTSPALAMLWERSDPAVELPRRFGLPDGSAVRDLLGRALREHWDLHLTACTRIVLSSTNLLAWVDTDAGPFVVKACGHAPSFDRLAAITEVIAQLGDRVLPVAPPRRSRAGAARVVVPGDGGRPELSIVVMPEVAGALIDPTDPVVVHATGALLARVHAALAELEVELPGAPEVPRPVPGPDVVPAQLVPGGSVWRERAPRAAARLDHLVGELPALDVAPSLVHGDVRGANVLVGDDRGIRMVGVDRGISLPEVTLVDWDGLTRGPRVLDLAAGAARLATRFHSWDPPPAEAAAQLVAGYRTVCELTPVEERWLEAGVLAMGLSQIPPGPDPAGWARAVERGL